MKILLAVDDSPYSSEAVRVVVSRTWPPGTTARVLSAVEDVVPPAAELWYDAGGDLERTRQGLTEQAEQLTVRTAESLAAVGLEAETAVRHGDPRSVIVNEASEWGADLIVLGSHGYRGLRRLLLGSVAQWVVSHAPCSVEVVRLKSEAEKESVAVESRRARGATGAQAGRREGDLRLEELIAGFSVAMLTTVTADGHLHSRPMVAHSAGSSGDLWFFTHAHTHLAEEVERHQQVNVSYADPSQRRYVSVSGKALLVEDRQQMEELWDPVYEDWFSQGLADRDLALLRVSVESAEYWDSRGSVMVRLMAEPQNTIRAREKRSGVK
ncbi:MAG TPA: pyridoxamine 5'-phosphate oxidase family protein [Blastocatellia bacterium]|nr:pyridoxamine 5'-phosphate oxidase family protein [Blastocatellia bacterium]